jgi:hypothetical protein
MRIDRRLSRDVLTERQLYFIECWSNFCHKNSPDTDRSDTAIHSAPSANCYFFTKWKIVSVPIKKTPGGH